MSEPETRQQRYERQTTEQFALLGRFIQAFELMVHWARLGCITLTASTRPQQQKMNRVFHNQAMGAWALFEIWRDILTVQIVEQMPELGAEDREAAKSILAQLAKDYQELVNRRNQIVHGTWLIGWAGSGQDDFSELQAFKMRFKKSGEASSAVLKDFDELKSVIADCDRVAALLQRLTLVLSKTEGQPRVLENFAKLDGKWTIPLGSS